MGGEEAEEEDDKEEEEKEEQQQHEGGRGERVEVRGVAYAGACCAIARVEVSPDGGATGVEAAIDNAEAERLGDDERRARELLGSVLPHRTRRL